MLCYITARPETLTPMAHLKRTVLRVSALDRLIPAAAALVVLWLGVWWALG